MRGDTRFRNQQDEVEFTADAEGLIRIPLTEPGQYLFIEHGPDRAALEPVQDQANRVGADVDRGELAWSAERGDRSLGHQRFFRDGS